MPISAEHRAKYEANRNRLDTGNNTAPCQVSVKNRLIEHQSTSAPVCHFAARGGA
jgi:hypothetical protein